jgi:hypothetical protein
MMMLIGKRLIPSKGILEKMTDTDDMIFRQIFSNISDSLMNSLTSMFSHSLDENKPRFR